MTALAEVRRVDAARRVIVVLGDGNDTNNDRARAELAALLPELERLRVELYGIRWGLHPISSVLQQFLTRELHCSSVDCLEDALASVWRGPAPAAAAKAGEREHDQR